MNISTQNTDRVLAPKQAENFLRDLVNISVEHADTGGDVERSCQAIAWMKQKYPAFFERQGMPSGSDSGSADWLILADVQVRLRAAWDTSDFREREWLCFLARYVHHKLTVIQPFEVAKLHANSQEEIDELNRQQWMARLKAPPMSMLEQALYYFQRHARRARHCGNPECPAPRFFAKKNFRHCSPKCAASLQREHKRNWWEKVGSKRRADRRAK